MEKRTNAVRYAEIREILINAEAADDLIELVDAAMDAIAVKAEKARARQAEKKAAGDELRATVQSVLIEEYQSANDITAAIGDEEVTRAKVIARLRQLVDAGIVEKADAKGEDGKTFKVYKLA